MGLPPSEAGAVQVSVAWALPAVAVPTVGAPGTLIGAGAGAGAVPDEIAQMWPESGTRPALGSSPAYTVPSGSTASPLTELKPDAYTPGFAVDSGTARSRRQTLVASPAYSVLLPSETSDNGAASPSAAVGRAVAGHTAAQLAGFVNTARPRELACTSSVDPRTLKNASESVSRPSGLAATVAAGSPRPTLGWVMRTMLALPLKPRYRLPVSGSTALAEGRLAASPSVGRNTVVASMVSVAWLKCRRTTPTPRALPSGT